MGPARHVPGSRPASRDTGAAALEFALVAPLLIFLLFAVLGTGWGLWELQAARATATEAARLASVGIGDLTVYQRNVICLGERNGMRKEALSRIDLQFFPDATLTTSASATVGGYVTVRLAYLSALDGALLSPFTGADGLLAVSAVTRIEQTGEVVTGQGLTIEEEVCA